MIRTASKLVLAVAFAGLVGCSDTKTNSDPKMAPGNAIDPAIKPAGTGVGKSEAKGVQAVKGD